MTFDTNRVVAPVVTCSHGLTTVPPCGSFRDWRTPPEWRLLRWPHCGRTWMTMQRCAGRSWRIVRVTTQTLESDVAAHPHFGGQQDGGGEKKYEGRHRQSLDRYYDEVIAHLGTPEALLIFGPGEAKLELKERLGRSATLSQLIVDIETAGRLTDPQIVAKVTEHFSDTGSRRRPT